MRRPTHDAAVPTVNALRSSPMVNDSRDANLSKRLAVAPTRRVMMDPFRVLGGIIDAHVLIRRECGSLQWQGYRLVYESCQYARQALRVIIAHEACPTPLFLSKTPPKAPDA